MTVSWLEDSEWKTFSCDTLITSLNGILVHIFMNEALRLFFSQRHFSFSFHDLLMNISCALFNCNNLKWLGFVYVFILMQFAYLRLFSRIVILTQIAIYHLFSHHNFLWCLRSVHTLFFSLLFDFMMNFMRIL